MLSRPRCLVQNVGMNRNEKEICSQQVSSQNLSGVGRKESGVMWLVLLEVLGCVLNNWKPKVAKQG